MTLRRVFVVGTPRSGTTLVQSLLAAHRSVTSFTESHFFSRHFRLLPGSFASSPRALLHTDPRPCARAWLIENGMAEHLASRLDEIVPRKRWMLWWSSRAVAAELLRLLDEVAAQRRSPCWVEKTPRHLHFVPFLADLACSRHALERRRTDFVHVVRRPGPTVRSLHAASRQWSHPYSIAACVRRWNHDLQRSRARLASPRDHFLFYEELVASPESTTKALLADLDLPWQADVLQHYGEQANALVTAAESWKSGVARPIASAGEPEQKAELTHAHRLRDDLYEEFRDAVAARRPGAIDAT